MLFFSPYQENSLRKKNGIDKIQKKGLTHSTLYRMLLLPKFTKVVFKIYPKVRDFFRIQKCSHAITKNARHQQLQEHFPCSLIYTYPKSKHYI